MSRRTDPRLGTYSWSLIVRYWKRKKAQPCARCGGEIDYGWYRRPIPGTNRYTINPNGLHVGHKLARALDPNTRTWVLADTQPEHVRCSVHAGGRLGAQLRRIRKLGRQQLDTSRRW